MARKPRGKRFAEDEMDLDEDAVEGNPHARRQRKKSTFLKIPRWVYKISAILILCVLSMLVWFNRANLTPDNVMEWVQTTVVGMGVGDGFPSAIAGTSVSTSNFASVNQEAVIVSDTALTILNSTAKQLVNRQHSYSKPVMCANSSRILIYNLGGTGYQIESHSKNIVKSNTTQNITAGAIASNGRYALVTEDVGYCSMLTAYLKNNTVQYKYEFEKYYVTGVSLNEDGTKAAVCAVSAQDGGLVSAIYLFDFNNPKPVAALAYSENMILSVTYCRNGKIIAVGDSAASVIDESTKQKTDYSYQGQKLVSFAVEDGKTVLALSPYERSTSGKLVALDSSGKTTALVDLKQKLKSAALFGDTMAVLADGKVYAYSITGGTASGSCSAGSDAKAVALRNESSAYILGVSTVRLENFK